MIQINRNYRTTHRAPASVFVPEEKKKRKNEPLALSSLGGIKSHLRLSHYCPEKMWACSDSSTLPSVLWKEPFFTPSHWDHRGLNMKWNSRPSWHGRHWVQRPCQVLTDTSHLVCLFSGRRRQEWRCHWQRPRQCRWMDGWMERLIHKWMDG